MNPTQMDAVPYSRLRDQVSGRNVGRDTRTTDPAGDRTPDAVWGTAVRTAAQIAGRATARIAWQIMCSVTRQMNPQATWPAIQPVTRSALIRVTGQAAERISRGIVARVLRQIASETAFPTKDQMTFRTVPQTIREAITQAGESFLPNTVQVVDAASLPRKTRSRAIPQHCSIAPQSRQEA